LNTSTPPSLSFFAHLTNNHRFKKQYVEPRLAEGFTEIKPITFVPQFDNPDQEKLFHQLT
jgi:hypothetical protein